MNSSFKGEQRMFMRIFKLSAVTFDPKELKGRADKGPWKQHNVGLRMAEQTSQESTVSWPELIPNICLQEPLGLGSKIY